MNVGVKPRQGLLGSKGRISGCLVALQIGGGRGEEVPTWEVTRRVSTGVKVLWALKRTADIAPADVVHLCLWMTRRQKSTFSKGTERSGWTCCCGPNGTWVSGRGSQGEPREPVAELIEKLETGWRESGQAGTGHRSLTGGVRLNPRLGEPDRKRGAERHLGGQSMGLTSSWSPEHQ